MKNLSSTFFGAILPAIPDRLLDKIGLTLVFLFPLCGNLIKSWYSTLFFFIAITSLFYIRQGWPLLDKFQKSMAYALLLYFAIFLLQATLLGWHADELKALGVEIRLVFIIPLLCMASTLHSTRTALFLGLIGSLVILLGQTFYELLIMQQWRVTGTYNPLRVSAMALVSMALLVPWLYFKKWHASAVLVALCCALIIVGSQGRMAMIAALAIALLFCLTLIKRVRNIIIALTGVLVVVIALVLTPTIQQRFSEVDSLMQYIAKEKQYAANEVPGSWVTHYMMLEASWLLLKEHPMLGVGTRHYPEHIQTHIEAERVHPIVGHDGLVTPHTLIAEIAVSKGLLGVLAFLLFIIMVFRLAFHRGREGIALGMFMVCILLTGISEAWWVRTGSFVAIMTVLIAILSTSNKNQLSDQSEQVSGA
ncbi:MAG: O-antigen ligase [Gammaproteobacteria bacterium]|jgi:O-antigen ligase